MRPLLRPPAPLTGLAHILSGTCAPAQGDGPVSCKTETRAAASYILKCIHPLVTAGAVLGGGFVYRSLFTRSGIVGPIRSSALQVHCSCHSPRSLGLGHCLIPAFLTIILCTSSNIAHLIGGDLLQPLVSEAGA